MGGGAQGGDGQAKWSGNARLGADGETRAGGRGWGGGSKAPEQGVEQGQQRAG